MPDQYAIHADVSVYFKNGAPPLQGDLIDYIFVPDTEAFVQLMQDPDIMRTIAEREVSVVNMKEVAFINVTQVRIKTPERNIEGETDGKG